MNKIGWIIVIALSAICVFLYLRKPEQAPPVIPGVTMRMDTVIIHDTIKVVRHDTNYTVRVIPARRDSSTAQKDTAADSTVCYDFSETYPSGTFILLSVCSRFLSKVKPSDLERTITYRPGNDTMKSFYRVDTVPKIIYKNPIIPTWQSVTIGLTAGVLVGWLALK